jgi:hypothetical protein
MVHVTALRKLFDSGVTIVNVHSGQPDQQKIIDFYGRSVNPPIRRLRQPGAGVGEEVWAASNQNATGDTGPPVS